MTEPRDTRTAPPAEADERTAAASIEPARHPLVPVRNLVIFPGQVLPLTIGRPRSRAAAEAAGRAQDALVTLTQRRSEVDEPGPDDLHAVGTRVQVLKMLRMPDGSLTAVVQGRERVRPIAREDAGDHDEVRVEVIEETTPEGDSIRLDALVNAVKQAFQRFAQLAPHLSGEHVVMVHNAAPEGRCADAAAMMLQTDLDETYDLFATLDVGERLEKVLAALHRRIEVLELSSKIESDVESEFTKVQREHYLREQLRAIHRELGEGDDPGAELDELRERVAEAGMPEAAREAAEREIRRLGRINPASPEHGVARTYVDWLLDVPWTASSPDDLDLERARAVLDRDHYDLEKVKKRIVEFLAVRRLKNDMKGPILCLAGPPGVGKTSLGRSIAEALGRRFQRISLGGVRDEAEIRGHRRTYVGSLPGRIVQAMKKAGTVNPVILLDEIDKLGRDAHGDPSSALLEVLDPEQNATFSDHYLEVPYDLSRVLFIATANWLGSVPAPLRDRMEIIELPGYAPEDKLRIATRHLLPKQIGEHGLERSQLTVTRKAIEEIVDGYTREAGVRALERRLADVVRAAALEIAAERTDAVRVDAGDLVRILGPRRHVSETAERTRHAGVATGLAWTPTGGEILFVEATRMAGKGRLQLTGKLGAVMKESAQAAMSWMRAAAGRLGLEDELARDEDVHLHVPAGAVAKDGPSAGVALATALVSLFTDRPVKSRVAMTGEITLRGLVLPVGGIKEKVLAARRAGIKTVILPERNRPDVEEIPEDLRRSLEIVFVREIDEVLEHALGKRRLAGSRKRPAVAREDA